MDPLSMVEEKYHLVVTLGYAFVVAVIILVLASPLAERVTLFILGVLFFGAIMRLTRKGLETPPKFEV